jgi:hypothetical protein
MEAAAESPRGRPRSRCIHRPARRAETTWPLCRLFPTAAYFLPEELDILGRLRADRQGFLDAVKTPGILDVVHASLDTRPRAALGYNR